MQNYGGGNGRRTSALVANADELTPVLLGVDGRALLVHCREG